MKGFYVLLLSLPENSRIRIGCLGSVEFKKGFYAYVGSGMKNMESRLERHLKSKKKEFWHIDYFLRSGKIMKMIYGESREREECEIAKKLSESFDHVKNFGCSDCSCDSHLFFSEGPEILESSVKKAFRELKTEPKIYPASF